CECFWTMGRDATQRLDTLRCNVHRDRCGRQLVGDEPTPANTAAADPALIAMASALIANIKSINLERNVMKLQMRLTALLFVGALFVVAGCGAPAANTSSQASPASADQAAPKAGGTAPASAGNPAAPKASAPANNPNTNANCAALDAAYFGFA